MPVVIHLVTAVVITVLTAAVVSACSQAEPTTASPASSTPTTVPSATASSATASSTETSSSEQLTEAETAWLTAASKTAARVDKELGRHPEAEEVTRSNLLALATVLRACSRDLARIGRPSQRLQPVYAAIQRACGHYDRAARCVETAASLIDAQAAPGSRADRKINEAMDCLSVGMTAGSTAMVDAKEKSIDIRVASGGL